MHLEGSCHCGAVRFELDSAEPVPYQRCYCGICRKTSGGGGFIVNLGGDARTLRVEGEEHVRAYRALIERDGEQVRSGHTRSFCVQCGGHLWAAHDDWPDLVHPVASAIDTPLPVPPQRVHIMLGSRASWAEPDVHEGDELFEGYPALSLADWHKAHAG